MIVSLGGLAHFFRYPVDSRGQLGSGEHGVVPGRLRHRGAGGARQI